MPATNNDYGLVVCGGKSTRMGTDKGLLSYHDKPQRFHVYEMLEGLCEKTFISCNRLQANGISEDYPTLVDLPQYSAIGPIAALLTAFAHHPTRDFLVVACDYPFITTDELRRFSESCERSSLAAAFYNHESQLYEPLLAWYSCRTARALKKLFEEKNYSLQYFLHTVNGGKYYPPQTEIIQSVDTPESAEAVKVLVQNKVHTIS